MNLEEKAMKVLVTGGAGFIGSHTCVELLNAGHELIIVDNFSNSKKEVLNRIKELTNKDFTFYQVDLLDRTGVKKVFSENTIDAVIHFAGWKAVGESVKQPLKYYHNNITGTLVLCELMQEYKVKNIVFSSSATVYGNPEKVPISEEFPLQTTNPYGSTKLMIERILQDLYGADHGWSICLLRYFNPIGAHESGRIGEDPNGIPNNLLPFITQVAIGKREQLSIYGKDYATHDGTGVRDYIHVVDLAKGHLMALEQSIKGAGIEIYNLGTGVGYSVLDVVANFEKATGKRIPYEMVERRAGDIACCYADVSKAKEHLGWVAKKDIEDMCRDSWNWQVNNPNGYE